MTRVYLFLLCCCVLWGAGCAKTTVVLLPDEAGTVGEVVVSAAGEQRVLARADEQVEATSGGVSKVREVTPQAVAQAFAVVLKMLPEPPESILVYFTSESTHPTAESARQLDRVLPLVNARPAPSVELFGHTDHMGDRKYNQELSDARAKEVRRLLFKQGVPAEIIREKGFGDRDPLVPPRPGKSEPRNRRVEIFVR